MLGYHTLLGSGLPQKVTADWRLLITAAHQQNCYDTDQAQRRKVVFMLGAAGSDAFGFDWRDPIGAPRK